MAEEILTEAGTNEMEMLVFNVGDTPYGVNVAKMREIIQRPKTISIPNSPEATEGSFQLREAILTLIDLGCYLGVEYEAVDINKGLVIVVEMNQILCGILVDGVQRIHRLRWEQIEPPGEYLEILGAPITGVTIVDDQVVQILDFETILGEILGSNMQEVAEHAGSEKHSDYSKTRVLVVDDSPTIRTAVEHHIRAAGFEDVVTCANGEEAWNTLNTDHEAGEHFDIILSDIEMPLMDGLHLTSKIKADPRFRLTPVILFSSLISEANMNKGIAAGADAQVTKFKSNELLQAIDQCL